MSTKQTKHQSHKIGLVHQLAYGSGNLLGSGALAISGTWAVLFWSTIMKIDIVSATLIFSVATWADVILNPVVGYITDNFYRTKIGRKFGRRRFFIMIGIPLMVVYPLAYLPLPLETDPSLKWIYYFTAYMLFEVIYTSIMIPYEALAVEMTDNFKDRAFLTGSKAIFGKAANFIGQAVPGICFLWLGEKSTWSFFATGCFYGAIMLFALLFLYKFSWEKTPEEVTEAAAGSLWENIKKLFKDIFSTFRLRAFRNQLGMYLFGFGSEWLWASTFSFFVVFVLFEPKSTVSFLNSLSSILQLVSTMLFMAWCAKKGFRRPMQTGLTVVIFAILAYCAMHWFGIADTNPGVVFGALCIITAIFGIGTGGVYYIPWATYSFMADIDEALTGRRREGIYAASMTMAGKLLRSTIVLILGVVLAAYGFDQKLPAGEQPDSAISAIIGVAVIGVCGLALIGIYFSQRFKLDDETHQILITEVARRRDGGLPEEVTPEAKSVVETLTGWPYEKCFGNNNVGWHAKVEV